MEVHPVERHERKEVADMEGRSGRIYANVCADALLSEQPVEHLPSAVVGQNRPMSSQPHALTPQRP